MKDKKWQDYAAFTSSLSIACPEGLIEAEEVADPFGLLYVREDEGVPWAKKLKIFQAKTGLAWIYRYIEIIEAELPRLNLLCRQMERDAARR